MLAGIPLLTSPLTSSFSLVLVDSPIKGVLLLALAAAATLIMRRASAAARYQVWLLATLGLILIPVLSAVLPGWHALPAWADLTPAVSVRGPADAHIPTGAPPAASIGPARFWPAVFLLWSAGAVATMIPAALGLLGLRQLGRKAGAVTGRQWLLLLEDLRSRLRIKRTVLLLRGGQDSMPMTWGWFKPKILLPESANAWPAERRRMVLLHELAHIRRGDFAADLFAKLARAMHWFNPLAWLALRRLAAERERACDDMVLSTSSDAREYASHLLDVVTGLRSPRLAAALAIRMARTSTLEGRLLAILDRRRSRGVVTRTAMLASMAVLVAVLLPLSVLRAGPVGMEIVANGDASALSAEDGESEQPTEAGIGDSIEGDEGAVEEEAAETSEETGAMGGMGVGISAGGLNFPGGYPPAPAPPERTQPENTR